jgi:hypothetical protein
MKIRLTTALALCWAGTASAQDSCEQERSRREVQRLTQSGTIVSIDLFAPNVTVVVGERAWKHTDPATKKSIAQNIDCATFGADSRMLRSIYFRSNLRNEQLAEYSQNELKEAASAIPRSGAVPQR